MKNRSALIKCFLIIIILFIVAIAICIVKLTPTDGEEAAVSKGSAVTEQDLVSENIPDTASTQNTDTSIISEADLSVAEVSADYEVTDVPETAELTLAEKDKIHAVTRREAALPYETLILDKYREYYDRNNYVIGYIRLDETDVDCPVLQKLEDYEFYLTHDINDNSSNQGCIILDPDSEIGIGTKSEGYLEGYSPTTVQLVHGHNMRSGTMFGTLENYASEQYGNSHKYIYFDSLYEERIYELVLAFYSQIYPEDSTEFKYYNFNHADTIDEFNYWYQNISKLALYHTDVDVSYGDEFITLSTCAYQTKDGRFAVVGKRIK